MSSVVALWTFAEPEDELRPTDAAGGVEDLATPGALTTPTVGDGLTGPGRVFVDGSGFEAADIDDALNLTRDVTVQAILKLDLSAQDTIGEPGVIIASGTSFQLFVEVLNVATRSVRVKMWWDAGVTPGEGGGAVFVAPASGYVMLTASRFWQSDTECRERYYINDRLVLDATSTDGDVVFDATDPITVGCRDNGAGGYEYHLAATLDALRVTDYEITIEETAGIWQRITKHQPDGGAVVRASVPPGVPWPKDADSYAQRMLATQGDGVGYAIALIEDLRNNYSPERAWQLLEDWERITKLRPKLLDSVEVRRDRVLGFLRRVHGFYLDGVRTVMAPTFDLSADDVEIVEYTNEWADSFPSGAYEDWWTAIGNVGAAAGDLQIQLDPADNALWGSGDPQMLYHSIDGFAEASEPSQGADFRALCTKANFAVDFPSDFMSGIFAKNADNEMIFLGFDRPAGTTRVVWRTWTLASGLSAATVLATGVSADYWVRLRFDGDDDWTAFHGASDPSSNETAIGAGITLPLYCGIVGMTSDTSLSADGTCEFGDWVAFFPNGQRVFCWYAYRDPALAGTPDMPGARIAIEKLKPAHTHGAAVAVHPIECDDDDSFCDDGPLS